MKITASSKHENQTDSFITVQLIEQQKALNFESLKYMAEQVRGSFCFTVLDDQEHLYFVKGDNPRCLYHFPKTGLYLYASTEEILRKAFCKMHGLKEAPVSIKVSSGDILCVATGKTIYANKIVFHRFGELFISRVIFATLLGWILIPLALIRSVFQGMNTRRAGSVARSCSAR